MPTPASHEALPCPTGRKGREFSLEAGKNILGTNGRPSYLPIIDAGFIEGKEHLKVYCQMLMVGLISVGLGSAPPI